MVGFGFVSLFLCKMYFMPFPPPGITSTIISMAATAFVSCFCPVLSPGILFTRLPHVQLIALSLRTGFYFSLLLALVITFSNVNCHPAVLQL